MAQQSRVRDESTLHTYRTELPNIIDDMDLSVYAFRLYAHLKRRAGDTGECWEGTRKLAETCKMSIGQVSKAKQELKDRGLILITQRKTASGPGDEIAIIDIWPLNFETFNKRSLYERSVNGSVHTVNASDEIVVQNGSSVHTVNTKRSYSEREEEPMEEEPPPPPTPHVEPIAGGGGGEQIFPQDPEQPQTLTAAQEKTKAAGPGRNGIVYTDTEKWLASEGMGVAHKWGHLPLDAVQQDVKRRRALGQGWGAIDRQWDRSPPRTVPPAPVPKREETPEERRMREARIDAELRSTSFNYRG